MSEVIMYGEAGWVDEIGGVGGGGDYTGTSPIRKRPPR